MPPHPPVRPRPRALWAQAPEPPREWLRSPAILPYRPDWFARLPPTAAATPPYWEIALRHPACAVAALSRDYSAAAPGLDRAVAGSGEAVYHLLGWAGRAGIALRQPPAFYREALLRDGYWGLRHAQRTGDRRLARDVEAWAADNRREYAGAAAVFLMRRPSEPLRPYEPVLRSNPFYLYAALPKLYPRGLAVQPADAPDPKWAFHFALSAFTAGSGDFTSAIESDPAWAFELLQAKTGGRIAAPEAGALARRLQARCPSHPLSGYVAAALEILGHPSMRIPGVLSQGVAAEKAMLSTLQQEKNSRVWRPTREEVESPEFKRIVGPAQYTAQGFPRGTIIDGDGPALHEFKSGHSPLAPSYQLRLQAYRAKMEGRTLHLHTSRPVAAEFAAWLQPLGVSIEPLP